MAWLLVSGVSMGLAGCNNKILDPSQIGRFRSTPAVNVILNSLGVAEESAVAWESAQEPQPNDIVAVKVDYALRPGDLVRVSIYELFQEGVPAVNDYTVSETGKVSIPDVGAIPAAGLTERQLEEQIKQILSPGVLRNPSVTVTLLDSQQRTFSILGNAVARPSRYLIPRYDFRLADALATAGAQTQFNVSYVYVSRKGQTVADAAGAVTQGPAPELNRLTPGSSGKIPPDFGLSRASRSSDELSRGVGKPVLPPSRSSMVPSSHREIPQPAEPAQKFESEREMLDLIAPRAQSAWPQSRKLAGALPTESAPSDVVASVVPGNLRVQAPPQGTSAESVVQTPIEFGDSRLTEPPLTETKPRERTEWIFRDGKWVQVTITDEGSRRPKALEPSDRPVTTQGGPNGGGEWTLRDGKWVRTDQGGLQTVKPPTAAAPAGPAQPSGLDKLPMEAQWEQAIQTRLIRIPADKLLAGDPRYNIIIKPGDTIHVPVDIIGEFVIGGNVNRSGYIDITGRQMTLKMAIAAAGGLGPLAWPKNVEVIRRIGTAREEIVMVDLDKIASGEQPDFFIKPNDMINVGTHPTSRWRAVLRNAFRATYGFGFVYDRNFADIDYGTGFPWVRNL
jgi:protein involved in polysaccharide export with SLBB domain